MKFIPEDLEKKDRDIKESDQDLLDDKNNRSKSNLR
jgi:hypothetical protein